MSSYILLFIEKFPPIGKGLFITDNFFDNSSSQLFKKSSPPNISHVLIEKFSPLGKGLFITDKFVDHSSFYLFKKSSPPQALVIPKHVSCLLVMSRGTLYSEFLSQRFLSYMLIISLAIFLFCLLNVCPSFYLVIFCHYWQGQSMHSSIYYFLFFLPVNFAPSAVSVADFGLQWHTLCFP